jgi:hypothetical protein
MSVLIEAVCLVVPRRVLDVSYPGGTEAYLEATAARDGVRFAIADDHVTSVGSYDGDVLVTIVQELMELGLVWSDGGRAYDCIIVDQEMGPAIPCDWLEVQRHPHGFTQAWHAVGAFAPGAAGDLVAPEGWRLEVSWRLTRTDVRDGNDDWLQLATDDDGLETWLDFSTGRMNRALPEEPKVLPVDHDAAKTVTLPVLGPALGAVRAVLDLREIPYRLDVEHGYVSVPIAAGDVDRVQVMVSPIENGEALRCDAVLPDRVAASTLPHVQALAAALRAACPGCAVRVDGQTRTVHVTTWLRPQGARDRLKAVERALCHAAEQAGRVHAAIALAAAGEEQVDVCVRPIARAQERFAAT